MTYKWSNLKYLSLSTNYVYKLWCFDAFYIVLFRNQFYLDFAVLLRNRFVAIYELLRGENLGQKLCRGEKMTNMRYEHKVHQPNHQVPQAKQTGSFCASVCGNVWIENLDFSNYVFQCFSCTLVNEKTATPLGPPIATGERTF